VGWVGGRGGCFFAVGGEVLGCWLTMDFLRQVRIEDIFARRYGTTTISGSCRFAQSAKGYAFVLEVLMFVILDYHRHVL